MKTYKIFFINFGYFSDRKFTSFKEAANHVHKTGFEASIYEGNERIASWGPLSGFVYMNPTVRNNLF